MNKKKDEGWLFTYSGDRSRVKFILFFLISSFQCFKNHIHPHTPPPPLVGFHSADAGGHNPGKSFKKITLRVKDYYYTYKNLVENFVCLIREVFG